ncbi:MAG: HD domain-containing protein [Brachybacterium sp.]|nr:HD domain-containing protein [Brachybacterium sp.]
MPFDPLPSPADGTGHTPAGPGGAFHALPGPLAALADQRHGQVLDWGLRTGGDGRGRRAAHTDLIDTHLRALWDAADAPPCGAALVALGSLGRGDPGPVSDLDLLLLIDPELGDHTTGAPDELAKAIWYPIWNAGLPLDHALRTVDEAEAVAAADLRSALSMLDMRFIAGDPALADDARTRIRAIWRTEARRRHGELLRLAENRSERYALLAHAAEPDLKSDRGGLRDVTVIRAFAGTWLADHDHTAVDSAAATLLDVRDALQAATTRPGTRLRRADQEAVAGLCGYDSTDALLVDIAGAARIINWELQRVLRAARGATSDGRGATRGRGAERRPALQRLPHGVIVQAGEVSTDPAVTDPVRDLAAIRHATATGLSLAEGTLRRLGRTPPDLPLSAAQRDMLVDALAGEHLVDVYESLDAHGAFAPWIPGWEEVRHRPQHSPVHRFTVDRHQVETVREAQAHLAAVDRPDLLLVAALLHDIGKRPGATDHSRTGAPLAEHAARALGFEDPDIAVIASLVREHLTLVDLATRRDPVDPATVAALLQAVDHDPGRLDLLRALTEADARGAGPAAWSPWRATLVDHLTDRARAALDGPLRGPRELLAPQPAVEQAVLTAVHRTSAPHVLYPAATDGETLRQICLGAPDGPGVFAAMSRTLARHRLDVRSAVLTTREGIAVNTWWVAGSSSDLPHPSVLRTSLVRELAAPSSWVPSRPGASPPDLSGGGGGDVVVSILQSAADAAVLQVNAPSRPGLLADVAATVDRYGLSLARAHVLTLGLRAVDVLHLTDERGHHPGTEAVERLQDDLRRVSAPAALA